ncbi:hypothetical protein PF005_g22956, partial [Phytophthora fragariae]
GELPRVLPLSPDSKQRKFNQRSFSSVAV